ncbi:hypothetical protein SDC9_173318 [bioreactor metagenome]|uniref:Uncharacterized protein n=1 Tax=bioreactor metagenome TaxID=1076179 RepID=A0A645GG49_9ZZZZ
MALEFRHERLAETHNFSIALAVRIKVRAALAAAHGQGGEAVFESLLKAKELHNGQIHVRSKAQAALVGADCTVELDAIATIHLNLASIVHPGDPEFNRTLRLGKPLKQTRLLVFGMLADDGLKALENLFHGLQELGLIGIAFLDFLQDCFDVSVHLVPPHNGWLFDPAATGKRKSIIKRWQWGRHL